MIGERKVKVKRFRINRKKLEKIEMKPSFLTVKTVTFECTGKANSPWLDWKIF